MYIPRVLHTVAHGSGGTLSGLQVRNCSVSNANGMSWGRVRVRQDASNSIIAERKRPVFRWFDFRRKSPQAAAAAAQGVQSSQSRCIHASTTDSDIQTFMQCLCSVPRVLARSRTLLSRHFLSLLSRPKEQLDIQNKDTTRDWRVTVRSFESIFLVSHTHPVSLDVHTTAGVEVRTRAKRKSLII